MPRDIPILFSAPMIRALLAGTKTQTRRIINPQPLQWVARVIDVGLPQRKCDENCNEIPDEWGQVETVWSGPIEPGMCEPDHEEWLPIKTRKIGDRLWVREAYAQFSPHAMIYRCDHPEENASGPRVDLRWRPSINMPRWASRLTLIVTDVRVQRLQDISEADALAEGIERIKFPAGGDWGWPKLRYANLWNAINGPGAWDANPWVVALTFDVVRQNIDAITAQAKEPTQ